MMSRRDLLATGALGTVAALSGCAAPASGLVSADVARSRPDPARMRAVVDAVGAFSGDLLAAVAQTGNLVCSPYSILVALAMVRNGATGQTAREIDDTLHLPALDTLNAGLNALDQTLATRSGRRRTAGDTRAEVAMRVANRVWGQSGYTWQPPFLNTLAASYGSGVGEVDLSADPDGSRRRLNDWVADQTQDKILDLLPPGSVDAFTRMLLANALYVKAPWHQPFFPQGPKPFRTPTGPVDVEMMGVSLDRGGLQRRGWQAARIPLAGQELALTVIRPRGDLGDLRRELQDAGLVELLRTPPDQDVDLSMPGFQIRSALPLAEVLSGLGMPRAFTEQAEFDAMTHTEPLHIGAVQHQGWVAVDADGLEAAAATAVVVKAVSAPARPPLILTLDSPFLACVHDVATALPLLSIQISDPSATTG